MPFNTGQDPHERLREIVSERTRPLLAWVGSGVSAEAGLPTWPVLRASLIDGLRNKADEFRGEDRKKLAAVADQASREANPWIAFQILSNSLGAQSYRDLVRVPFNEAHRLQTPRIYGELWSIGVKGMLTLNLDRLAVRSLTEAEPGQTPLELSGDAVGRLRSQLTGTRPVVANLHGVFEDSDTWVFTQSQLAHLLDQPQYVTFLDVCLSMFTIVFVGISVDDVAVGGHLERAARLHVENPTHYWITPSRDFNIDQWAESVGVRVIRYDAPEGDHTQVHELFEDLRSYVSQDTPDPPPVHLAEEEADLAPATELPPEGDLLARTADELRQVLNAHATAILLAETEDAYEKYEAFSNAYDQAIYQAWYTSTQSGKNVLLGHELMERAARGAFGVVYRARQQDGRDVAVKVLLDEVRQDPESLRAFRRGVRSMRILQERGIEGMATYLAASEIPAFVVMDWIDGPNLAEAKRTKVIDNWHAVVDISSKLTRIIRSAHMLPERVLHRDIRPANVMLRDFWHDQETHDVVVLDFDLSWHKGAAEKSVLHSTSVGYLAPEQLRETGSSTRSALVDSFGLGMTFLFLCGGDDPIPDQHRHESWVNDVRRACDQLPRPEWVSLPNRMSRLILACTRDVQSTRWDVAQIYRELELLSLALQGDGQVAAPELVAEELAARCHTFRDYSWDDDNSTAFRDSATGLRLALRGDLANEEIALTVSYAALGGEDRAKLNRYIAEEAGTLGDQLKAQGWRVTDREVGYATLDVRASVSAGAIGQTLAQNSERLDRTLERLTFDRV